MGNESGRVVFVTGGSRGIGRACVEAFRAAGWRTASCATTVEGARASSPELALACDVTDKQAVKRAVGDVVRALGRLDCVVNNAGVAGENPLDGDDDDDVWHRTLDVNLNGTYYVSRACLPHLREGGRIINIGSVLSLEGVPEQSAYVASKHAVVGLTRALALHVARRGITVNCICPTWVRSDMMYARARELGVDEAALARGIPTGRVVEPDEVAGLALFLASDAARSITGQALVVDGGSLA